VQSVLITISDGGWRPCLEVFGEDGIATEISRGLRHFAAGLRNQRHGHALSARTSPLSPVGEKSLLGQEHRLP